MRIAIIGTRGIPNNYGGFEQFAEFLSVGLVKKGHSVTVYNSHNHPFKDAEWNGVHIIHCYDPENTLGTAGQFIYDLNCLMDVRKRKFDVLLVLGYTSISIWGRLFPKNTTTIINMDGLEWKRTKYSGITQRFLLYAERLAVKLSDFLISDSIAIQSYLSDKYDIRSKYIAYGAEIKHDEDVTLLEQFHVSKGNYYLVMARMEPENNIETILEGFSKSNSSRKILVIGNTSNKFGKHLLKRFRNDQRIIFAGTIYDAQIVHTLKAFCFLYFHGHSVGGTNPSLLEAMASRALVAAHDNVFNRAVLGENSLYFNTSSDVNKITEMEIAETFRNTIVEKNIHLIKEKYSMQGIINAYEKYLTECREVDY